MQGVLEHTSSAVEIVYPPEHIRAVSGASGSAGSAGSATRRMTFKEYRDATLSPLVFAVQEGKMGDFLLAPVFRAVLIPEGILLILF